MLPEAVFTDRRFAAALLALHLATLAAFAHRQWLRAAGGAPAVLRAALAGAAPPAPALAPAATLRVALTSNLIGIVAARSLHYQFYAWYFHSLPLLFCLAACPAVSTLVSLLVIELCWNVFPATAASSATLLLHHLGLLWGLWASQGEDATARSLGAKMA